MIDFKSDYFKNIFKLVGGATVSQFLPLLFAPITSRVYGPSDYGVMGVYLSISLIVVVLVSSHYGSAVILQKREKDAANLTFICLIVTIIVTALTLLGLLILEFTPWNNLEVYWWFLPVNVFLYGLNSTFSNWVTRKANFTLLNTSRVIQAIFTIIIQLFAGLVLPIFTDYRADFYGLMYGMILGLFVGNLYIMVHTLKRDYKVRALFSLKHIQKLLYVERGFLYYVFPNSVIYTFINQIPVYALNKFSTPVEVGHFNLSKRFLSIPITVIGRSVQEVFSPKVAKDFNEGRGCKETFLNTLKLLVYIGITPTVLLLVFGPELFAFVFGSEWYVAGEYAQLLSIMFFLKFCSSPLSYMYIAVGRLREDFIIHIYMIISSFLALYIGYEMFKTTYAMVAFFSANYCLIYMYYLIRSYSFAKRIDKKK